MCHKQCISGCLKVAERLFGIVHSSGSWKHLLDHVPNLNTMHFWLFKCIWNIVRYIYRPYVRVILIHRMSMMFICLGLLIAAIMTLAPVMALVVASTNTQEAPASPSPKWGSEQ